MSATHRPTYHRVELEAGDPRGTEIGRLMQEPPIPMLEQRQIREEAAEGALAA